jgi:ketosteroid isomerase-like protein
MGKIVLGFLLLLAAPAFDAQIADRPDTDEGRIVSLENAWNQATRQKDEAALKLLLAPDLVYVEYDGTLMDRAAYLASVRSPSLQPTRIVSESMKAHIYGSVAVVNGVYRESGLKNGEPYTIRERFIDTWLRQSSGWICVASQATLIAH